MSITTLSDQLLRIPINMNKLIVVIVILISVITGPLSAGEEVPATFMGYTLIHMPTTKSLEKNTLDFRVNHRFGNAKRTGDDFLGMDNGANTQISLDYAFTGRVTAGIARTGENKTYELRTKIAIFEESSEMPVSISYFGVAGQETQSKKIAYSPLIANVQTTGNSAVDSTVSSYNKYEYELSYNDRRSYLNSILISKRITDSLSLQTSLMYLHRNFIKSGLGNDRTGVSIGGRYKILDWLDISFEGILMKKRDYIGDSYEDLDRKSYNNQNNLTAAEINSKSGNPGFLPYAYFLNVYADKPVPRYSYPLSFGVDMEIGGHVFQLFVTNNRTLAHTALLRGADYDYKKGDFTFGFNMTRLFSFGGE